MKTILIAAAALILFASCEKVTGEGPVVTQQRPVAGFSNISSAISGNIYYTIDTAYKLELQAQQNILDILQTIIVGNQLEIRVKPGYRIKNEANIIIKLSAPAPEMIELTGAGACTVAGTMNVAGLKLRVSGSGGIHIPVLHVSGTLNATVSGPGNISIPAGTVQYEDLRISGSGKMDFPGLAAQHARTDISGSGDMWVQVSQTLNAGISGSGTVNYRGNPQITKQISGSGSVRPF